MSAWTRIRPHHETNSRDVVPRGPERTPTQLDGSSQTGPDPDRQLVGEQRFFGADITVDGIRITPWGYIPPSLEGHHTLIPDLFHVLWCRGHDDLSELIEESIYRMVQVCKSKRGVAICRLELSFHLNEPLFQVSGVYVVPAKKWATPG